MRKVLRTLRTIINVTLIVIMLTVLAVVGIAAYKLTPVFKQYLAEADALVASSSASDFSMGVPTYIYADGGAEIAELSTGTEGTYIKYKDLPKDVENAFIAIEDKRFYQHHGVDWASTMKSCFLLIRDKKITRGGSTITQQLIRNVFTSDIGFEKSYERKAKEILTAILFERKYSKEDILEFYVNNINFANNCYGVGNAALEYFDKTVDELSTSEIAFLCAIPNNPTYYNPRSNFGHTIYRRNIILREMYDQNMINWEEYMSAVNSSIEIIPKANEVTYNYESSFAIKCAVEALMENSGFEFKYDFDTQAEYDEYHDEYTASYAEAEHDLYSGGYSVYTTLNLKMQKKCQKVLDKALKEFKQKDKHGVYVMQGAGTVIDNNTGKVVAVIGGRSQTQTSYSWNRAWQTYMQPGSTIKPLAVYTPALENGYTPDSKVQDVKLEAGPKNAGNSYLGEITLRTAVEKSKNVVAWQVFDEIGPRNGLAKLQEMHFDKITPNDYFLPAALGGLYYGVNTVQMASGYATLANDGKYRQADCLTSIIDNDGKSYYKKPEVVQVYKKKACQQMLDILQGVAVRGTAAGLALKDNPKMPIACKTGTTNESRCAWFCGVTPYYSIAVYVGRDDSKAIEGLYGATYPKQIWADMQNELCRGKRVQRLVTKVKKKKAETPKPEKSTDVQLNPAPLVRPEPESKPAQKQESENKPAQKPASKPNPKPKPKPTEDDEKSSEDAIEEPSEDTPSTEDVTSTEDATSTESPDVGTAEAEIDPTEVTTEQ